MTGTKDKNKTVETLPVQAENNTHIPVKIASAMLQFLSRTQIQGNEAEAMVMSKQILQRIVQSNQEIQQ